MITYTSSGISTGQARALGKNPGKNTTSLVAKSRLEDDHGVLRFARSCGSVSNCRRQHFPSRDGHAAVNVRFSTPC
jgi:hypothetical protein